MAKLSTAERKKMPGKDSPGPVARIRSKINRTRGTRKPGRPKWNTRAA